MQVRILWDAPDLALHFERIESGYIGFTIIAWARTISPMFMLPAATSTRVFSVMCSDYAALELAPRFAEALAAAPNIRIEVSPLPENPTDSGRDLLTHDFVIAVPGIGIDGPSIGESVDEGEGNLERRMREGGQGTAIGLSEGALVLNAVQTRLAADPTSSSGG